MSPTLDILIASVYSRASKLETLLQHLARQIRPGVRVIVAQDNCELPIGEKRQQLIQAATADYVCFLDDDDWVADDYLPRIHEALQGRPDVVAFDLEYTCRGRLPQIKTAVLSTWYPMRRDMAALVPFEGGSGEDSRWARQIQRTQRAQHRVAISRVLYHYRHDPDDSVQAGSVPRVAHTPPRLKLPFVEWL